jgi:hypothetical protein
MDASNEHAVTTLLSLILALPVLCLFEVRTLDRFHYAINVRTSTFAQVKSIFGHCLISLSLSLSLSLSRFCTCSHPTPS